MTSHGGMCACLASRGRALDNWHRRVRRIGQRIGHIGPANEPIEPIGKPPRALDNWTIGTVLYGLFGSRKKLSHSNFSFGPRDAHGKCCRERRWRAGQAPGRDLSEQVPV